MEAVILAAGRGQRMEGLAKPFYKPLLEINGMPLVAYAVEYASASGVERVTVVASSANYNDISEALSSYSKWVRLVVQEEPAGPGHATMIGLSDAVHDQTMLLMSDNVMDQDIVVDMAFNSRVNQTDAIGVRTVTLEQASRFTRIQHAHSDNENYKFVEGTAVGIDDIWIDGNVKVWCGPVVFQTSRAFDVLSNEWANRKESSEMKIGPYLNTIMRWPTHLYDVKAFDVGIPSAYIASKNGDLV